MAEILVHTAEGELEAYRYPTQLEKIELEDADAIIRLYEKTLERVENRPEYERTLLLFYRRVKKHDVEVWRQPYLGVNLRYWRAIVWRPRPTIHDPNRRYLTKWWCKADGGRWITDTGYPRRNRQIF